MAHHFVDLLLRIFAQIHAFRDAAPDHLMVVLTVPFLVRGIGVTIKHISTPISLTVKLNGFGVGEFTAVIREQDGEDLHKDIRPEFKIQAFENIDNRAGIIRFAEESELEALLDKMDCQEHSSAFHPFDRIDLPGRQSRVGGHESEAIEVGAPDPAGLVNLQGFGLWFPGAHADSPRHIQVFRIQEAIVDIGIQGAFRPH